MNVLLSSPWLHPYLKELQDEFPEVEFAYSDNPQDLITAAAEAEVVLGQVTSEILAAAKQLRWIQSGSAGVEWMGSVPELANTDIIVCNTRGAHADTIAEHTFGMLVLLARGFIPLYEAQKKHEWQRRQIKPGMGLVGLTMGIIGLGNIGRAIGERAQAFKMKVIAVDAHDVPRPAYVSQFWRLDGLNELLGRSDIVVVATPITPETRGMLGPNELTHMKEGAFLLVVSRGGIIDEPTVVKMLREGKLAGAGLDVTETEPLPADNELWDAPNIFITPHSSPTSALTRNNVVAILKDNLHRYLAGQLLTNMVDKKLGY